MSPPLAERRAWPKLSETLAHPRRPDGCQSCGATSAELVRWEECDEWDRQTGVLVVLCLPCDKRLINPHPRLYRHVHRWQPWPGAMELCVACTHRDGLHCAHPDLRANGGPGLGITFPKPDDVILCPGGLRRLYQGPPTKCEGREGAAG